MHGDERKEVAAHTLNTPPSFLLCSKRTGLMFRSLVPLAWLCSAVSAQFPSAYGGCPRFPGGFPSPSFPPIHDVLQLPSVRNALSRIDAETQANVNHRGTPGLSLVVQYGASVLFEAG